MASLEKSLLKRYSYLLVLDFYQAVSKKNARRDNCRQREMGSILIIVLWSLCLLSTFALYSGIIIRQKITLVDRLNNRDSLRLIAEAGINRAVLELKKKDPQQEFDTLNEPWSDYTDIFKEIRVGPGKFSVSYDYVKDKAQATRYGCIDEARKINLNTADLDVIKRLLKNFAGLGSDNAEELACCIIDWRDSNPFYQHPIYGAEDNDYKSLNYPYEAKDAEFEVIDELLLVKGMSREILDKIKNFVTIYGSGSVNINTASREVLYCLGVNGQNIKNILSFRRGEDSEEATFDDNVFFQSSEIVSSLIKFYDLSPGDVDELNSLISLNKFAVKSEYFMVKSLASLDKTKQQLEVTAVINRKGLIKYWQEEFVMPTIKNDNEA